MTTRGRLNELTRLHGVLSGGGTCFAPKDIQRRLRKPVTLPDLPSAIYLEDFHELFQEETTRLEELDRKLSENIEQYSVKKDLHAQFHKQKSRAKDKGTNKLDIVVESASGLPSKSSHFQVKKDGKAVYTSMQKNKPNPVWNERYTVGIDSPSNRVTVDVIDSTTDKILGSVEINLKSLQDQLVHIRTYDMAKGKLTLRLQWCHDQIAFHKIFADKYEFMLAQEEAMLEKVSVKLTDMYRKDGDELLLAWFCSPKTERPTPMPKQLLNYESYHQSTIISLVNTPTTTTVATRYSRPADLSEIITPKLKYNKLAARNRGIDYFCVGIYKGKGK